MSIKDPHTTREGWLNEGVKILAERFFTEAGYDFPENVQVSCGFTKSTSDKAIGQCFSPECSTAGVTHMFICPTRDEPIDVLQILLHEMIHAFVGVEHGHKKPFRAFVKEFGMAGKPTATYAEEGSELWNRLASVSTALGPYPHKAMQPVKKGKKKGGSGWVRLMSPNDEGYRIVISPKMLEEHGAPMDPWGDTMVPAEED